MPVDNVQRFESLCNDARYLQELADGGNFDTDEVNQLTDVVMADILGDNFGFPVSLTGGLVEVVALNEDLEGMRVFVPNTGEVVGEYRGLNWRPETISYPDGTTGESWRICHLIGAQEVTYVDAEGDIIRRTPTSNVTVEGSQIDLLAPVGIHDYRRLALDGVCLKIDQIAMDEAIDLTEKAERISKFFRIPNAGDMSPEKARTVRQRISYLNELGLFNETLVSSPLAVSRSDDNAFLLKSSVNIMAKVEYISTDVEISTDGDWTEGTSCLSYEVVIPEYGHVSIPHIPGKTTVYSLA